MSKRSEASGFNDQIYEEACDWFVDMRTGDIDAAGKQRFDAWVRKSPEHLRAYLELSEIWDDAPLLDPARESSAEDLIARARDASAEIIPLNDALASKASAPARSPLARRIRTPLAAAATIACMAVGLAAFVGYKAWREPTYSTAIGEQRTVVLADGSRVQLNSRTRLKVRFEENGRNVDLLEGQALFKVAKNPHRPFIVKSGEVTVRAVGTVFDVDRKKTATTVTVLEGRVAVSSLAGVQPQIIGVTDIAVPAPVFVDAGEQVKTIARSTTQPAPANVAAATAWTQGSLVLAGSRLADVVEEFNRHNERQLILGDASLADMQISGVYSSTDPTLLVQFLRDQPALRVEQTESTIMITTK